MTEKDGIKLYDVHEVDGTRGLRNGLFVVVVVVVAVVVVLVFGKLF